MDNLKATPGPWASFEQDVPLLLQEDALQAMSEATGGYGSPSNVRILDRDQLDAINYRAHGIIEIAGEEYTFQMEDGNRNGTVLLAWNEDMPFERHVPTRWALQPSRQLVNDAINAGKGPFLLLKWDAILKNNPNIAEIPGKYSYDRHFQPGGKIEGYWREAAAKHHFEIVTQETADETRVLLAKARGEAE